MTLSEVSELNLLVFRMLFNFILPTMPLSLLVLGHNSESIRGSNISGAGERMSCGTRRSAHGVCGTTDCVAGFFTGRAFSDSAKEKQTSREQRGAIGSARQ